MTAVVFELLAERRKRNPTALTPEQRAAHAVHCEGVRIAAPDDLVQQACELAAGTLDCGEQMQIAISRANTWLRNAMRQRQHYTGGDLPPAA
ncbi:Leucyl/phenylalanyl-tRNA--protein transferase [Mizugakiibacter sediminis]|uniref:Leucyl/phenylalanyl-tRNA--protein transferase n=1 Tax=Mizugakiibacter sediminis TaxID=1475481 RepID=A0A0K8QSJ6_9GAMM|nr:hypothetical protein [Mizugakiibacter sediminis]GAP67357.1 Leucyl/phenylalanyl-tRNA--protein transferase [Mizugakiibacter sediminis]